MTNRMFLGSSILEGFWKDLGRFGVGFGGSFGRILEGLGFLGRFVGVFSFCRASFECLGLLGKFLGLLSLLSLAFPVFVGFPLLSLAFTRLLLLSPAWQPFFN